MNHEQIEREIENQITDATNMLGIFFCVPVGVTSIAHRMLVEKIISAAVLQTALTQAKAITAAKEDES